MEECRPQPCPAALGGEAQRPESLREPVAQLELRNVVHRKQPRIPDELAGGLHEHGPLAESVRALTTTVRLYGSSGVSGVVAPALNRGIRHAQRPGAYSRAYSGAPFARSVYRSRMPLGLDHGGWHLWRLSVSWARDRYRAGRGIRGTSKAQILKTRAGGRQHGIRGAVTLEQAFRTLWGTSWYTCHRHACK